MIDYPHARNSSFSILLRIFASAIFFSSHFPFLQFFFQCIVLQEMVVTQAPPPVPNIIQIYFFWDFLQNSINDTFYVHCTVHKYN